MAEHLDLEGERLFGEVLDTFGLLDRVALEPIRNPHSTTGDRDVHGSLLLLLAVETVGVRRFLVRTFAHRSPAAPGCHGKAAGRSRRDPTEGPKSFGVEATTAAATTSAPAERRAAAAAERVAPVVTTSSTSRKRRPATGAVTSNTPSRLRARSSTESDFWAVWGRAGANTRARSSPARATSAATGSKPRRRRARRDPGTATTSAPLR